MLSKNKIKFIQSLSRKKVREQEQRFLVEGNKMVLEAIDSGYSIEMICATTSFTDEHFLREKVDCELFECTSDELKKASLLLNPQQALAVVRIPENTFGIKECTNELSLALDFIQDPGNLGTIIRIADWFGIKHILCSENSVDCYNPKVTQASMGAIFRVQTHYVNLNESLRQAEKLGIPIFGTFLEGQNIYETEITSSGILVMGNEGQGISAEIANQIKYKINIPPFPTGKSGSESLNVATATAICCAEFRRRIVQ